MKLELELTQLPDDRVILSEDGMQILDQEDNLIVRHGNTLPYKTPYLCIRAGEHEGKRFYVTPETMMSAIDAAFFTTYQAATGGEG